MFGGQLLEVRAHQPSQRSLVIDRNFPDFPDQIIVQRKRDVHIPIIRETLNKGNSVERTLLSAAFVVDFAFDFFGLTPLEGKESKVR